MAFDSPTTLDNVREAAGGRFERGRVFLSEVRNELKRVTWPSRKEVYATTIVYPAEGAPFNVALIDCDEGFRLMSRVEDVPPEQVKVGMSAAVNNDYRVDKA